MAMLLDELDLMIVEEMGNNARQPVSALANKLGVGKTTVHYRLNRLLNEGVLTIAGIVKPEVLGYRYELMVGINVSRGQADAVATQLAQLQAITHAYRTTGKYSIIAWVILRDRAALLGFISRDISGISGITDFETMSLYQELKTAWSYFTPGMETHLRYSNHNPSDLDLSIIEAMQQDPRQTITKLAKTVGCSRALAKARLEKLIDNGDIRFVGIMDQATLGYSVRAMILIKANPDRVLTLAKELSVQAVLRYVCLTIGKWQICIGVECRDIDHMHKYLSDTLSSMPGILEYEIINMVKPVKNTFTLPISP